MRTHTFGAMKRALATLLALALAVSLPALAEDLTLGPEEAPALEVIDGGELSIDLLPELSDDLEIDDVDLELPDVLSLSPEAAGPEGLADNSSKPIPELQEYIFRRIVTGDSGITINKQDDLYLTTPEADIGSWKNSDDKVARITRRSTDCIFVAPLSVGVTTISISLVNGKRYKYTLTVKDGYALKKLSLTQKSATLFVGQDIDMKQLFVLEPDYANVKLNFRTSDKTVARVSQDCVVTAMKPGKATITVIADNGMKAAMSVVVKRNSTNTLQAKPTTKAVGKLSKQWTLWPRSLEMQGNGSIVCQLWLLNDSAGKLTAIKNLDLAISAKDDTGGTLIARSAFKSVKVNCPEKKWQTVTLTFPAKAVYCPA